MTEVQMPAVHSADGEMIRERFEVHQYDKLNTQVYLKQISYLRASFLITGYCFTVTTSRMVQFRGIILPLTFGKDGL